MGVSASETATESQLRAQPSGSIDQWLQAGTVTVETRV
jgi:hypothetical protein